LGASRRANGAELSSQGARVAPKVIGPFERRAREVAMTLDDLDEDDPGAAIVGCVAELLQFESAIAYGLVIVDDRARIDTAWTHGCGEDFVERFDAYLAAAPRQFGSYDPVCPDPSQRNRALALEDLGGAADTDIVRVLYPSLGLARKHQLRVLVCDGPALLGWVGGWRHEPFSDADRFALESLVAPLRRRLRIAQWLGRTSLCLAAMHVTMDAIGAPAFLVLADGVPMHANADGRALLDRDRRGTIERLARAVRSPDERVHVSTIRAAGAPLHHLVVLPVGELDVESRAAVVAKAWSLTPRQTDVLALLVRGAANKTIAATLGLSARTVEVHVTALLHRAQCGSRAELGAKFWQAR
jgi:DNA-binding CsgD family transcriptional regulator